MPLSGCNIARANSNENIARCGVTVKNLARAMTRWRVGRQTVAKPFMSTVLPPSSSVPTSGPGWEIDDAALIRRRAFFALLVLALAFFALLARLYFLQVVSGTNFASKAQRNRLRAVPVAAPRGLITDRNGVVLATSRPIHNVAVVPELLPSARKQGAARAQVLQNLATLLNLSAPSIEAQIAQARKRQGRYDAIPIATDVDLPTLMRIEENRAELGAGVLITDALRRVYPGGALAGHLLGYSGIVNERDLARAKAEKRKLGAFDRVGKSGIEREYNALLQGEPGAQNFEVDASERPLGERAPLAATPGATLYLTLDATLQRAAENALARARNNGAAVALDPRNGEILAMASRPGFDPNLFELPRAQFSAAYQKLVATPGHPLLNRAATSRFPPGSTFKMISAAAGLQKGVIDPNWTVTCNGGLRMGRFFGCWKTHGHGVNLARAIAESCDVYFYQMSLRLGDPQSDGPTYLAQTARKFGLGAKTGIDLPTDERGLVPDPAWMARVNAKRPAYAQWMPGNTLNMSIGQGDVLATPLQMALATAAVANGGTLWQPHLLRKSQSNPQSAAILTKTTGHNIGIDARNLQLIRAAMRRTVTQGTGRVAALPNVEVAGKTGSAEDANNALPHSWWVCFAPYDKPTIAIAVLVENSGHGSENALPIARDILQARFPLPAPTPLPTPKTPAP